MKNHKIVHAHITAIGSHVTVTRITFAARSLDLQVGREDAALALRAAAPEAALHPLHLRAQLRHRLPRLAAVGLVSRPVDAARRAQLLDDLAALHRHRKGLPERVDRALSAAAVLAEGALRLGDAGLVATLPCRVALPGAEISTERVRLAGRIDDAIKSDTLLAAARAAC